MRILTGETAQCLITSSTWNGFSCLRVKRPPHDPRFPPQSWAAGKLKKLCTWSFNCPRWSIAVSELSPCRMKIKTWVFFLGALGPKPRERGKPPEKDPNHSMDQCVQVMTSCTERKRQDQRIEKSCAEASQTKSATAVTATCEIHHNNALKERKTRLESKRNKEQKRRNEKSRSLKWYHWLIATIIWYGCQMNPSEVFLFHLIDIRLPMFNAIPSWFHSLGSSFIKRSIAIWLYKKAALTTETIECSALSLESIDNIKRCHCLSLCVFCVCNSVSDDWFQECLENTSC